MTGPARYGLRFLTLGYLAALLLFPLGLIFTRVFGDGLAEIWAQLSTPEIHHAFFLTCLMVVIAVPLNTVFGVLCALVIVRQRFKGRAFLNSLIDLPFAISPVVVGLALILVYGQTGWFGSELAAVGIKVIFSPVGMVLATVFVSLPFVVREVIPVLREIGTDQEQAAATLGATGWQTFWRITLPAIRWGVSYGIVLATARSLGEYGAVAVVSGKILGQTETLTLFVEQQYQNFNLTGAYVASFVLALMALFTLFLMNTIKPKEAKA